MQICLLRLIEDWCTGVVAILSSFSLATATQQETDTEINTETLNKSSQPSSSVQPTPTEAASTPKEKDVSTEKSKESVTVSIAAVTSNKNRVLWNLPLKASLDQLGIYGHLLISKCVIWGITELWFFVCFFSPVILGKISFCPLGIPFPLHSFPIRPCVGLTHPSSQGGLDLFLSLSPGPISVASGLDLSIQVAFW